MKVVLLGLSVTSSWGNGHATNYRGLMRALHQRGDEVLFLERDVPWYAAHRDLPLPPWGQTHLYGTPEELRTRWHASLAAADLVVVGSYVPDGVQVAEWALQAAGGAVAFYDIDTPITLGKLGAGDEEYLSAGLVPRFDLYLSFTAGPALEILHDRFGARRPEAFFCFVDEQAYRPVPAPRRCALSYLGTYSDGRQPAVEELLLAPARAEPAWEFVVAGPMYPPEISWPANVRRIEHLPPGEHPGFYCASAYTLNVTRPEMKALGHSPSVRLFEAAACGVPIISDRWPGLEEALAPGEEVLLADTAEEVLAHLRAGEERRRQVAEAGRRRVLAEHTATRRATRLHELVGSEAPR